MRLWPYIRQLVIGWDKPTFMRLWLAGRNQFQEALDAADEAMALAMSFIPDHPFTQWLGDFRQTLVAEIEKESGLE